ncbi:MAG: hypothetical protein JXN62_07015, partial [Bacteroidales bacterium]|nr:hypothetical protein [Bacteroidales bacterium]
GGYFTLNSTAVYPSPRISHRVPFGTGPSAAKFAGEREQVFFTYNIEAFRELRSLFGAIDMLSESSSGEIIGYYSLLPPGLLSFIDENEWNSTIYEIRHNTGSPSAFRKRFFGWFNMFRIVKYLNYVHNNLFDRQAVTESARILLSLTGDSFSSGKPSDLLIHYRSLDKLE